MCKSERYDNIKVSYISPKITSIRTQMTQNAQIYANKTCADLRFLRSFNFAKSQKITTPKII